MCEYCNQKDNEIPESLPHDKNDEYGESQLVVFDSGIVDLWIINKNGIIGTEEFKFNYCPMCGRKLGG